MCNEQVMRILMELTTRCRRMSREWGVPGQDIRMIKKLTHFSQGVCRGCAGLSTRYYSGKRAKCRLWHPGTPPTKYFFLNRLCRGARAFFPLYICVIIKYLYGTPLAHLKNMIIKTNRYIPLGGTPGGHGTQKS